MNPSSQNIFKLAVRLQGATTAAYPVCVQRCSILLPNFHHQQERHSSSKAPVPLMGLGKAVSRRTKGAPRHNRRGQNVLPRSESLNLDVTDWSDVFEAAQSYNPGVVPLPLRMGRPRTNKVGDVPPHDKGNIELLKIPNFFHLTPPAIKKHCEALTEYCSPWPEDIGHRPIRITTINHIYAGPSIRHPDSNKVKLQVYLKDLELDDHARTKLIRLVGHRYNRANDELTIITKSCPTRKQNKDYAYYLLTALYHEAWKTEDWEIEAEGKTDEEIQQEIDEVNAELNPKLYNEMEHRRRSFYRIINDKVIRYNKNGHPFVYEIRKHGISGTLTDEEKRLAKEEWEKIQRELPDMSTFDLPYRRSSGSEFDN
ncbi:small ribosomal subunit protein mS35-like [Clytia hemisphaerica]|uniref:Small ribosomal subunit protein mS35 mitochondrial conserved domain-containing protein n=1 Tax=Clytia hemisphaerica TaxID=252671 RepID=A0A7M5X0X7_9CNID